MFLVGCDFAAGPDTLVNPFPQYQSSFRMPTYDGRMVWTNAHYNHARRWVETHLRNPPFAGTLHRHAVGLPVKGEVRYENPMDMVAAVNQKGVAKMPKAPAARESDILGAAVILRYLKQKGYDAGDAVNPEHPDDFKYAFMGSSQETKKTLIEIAMNRLTGNDAAGKKMEVAGAVAPVGA